MLFETFRRNLYERPDEAAFLIAAGDRSLPISWRQFADDISALALIIRKKSPGAVIGILGENSYEWITAHAACLFSGACAVPMDVNLSAEEIAERLIRTGAGVLVHSSLYDEKACRVQGLIPGLTVAGFGTMKTDVVLNLARKALAEGEKGIFELSAPDTGKTSMIMFTSGTTSEPRGVELTIEGIELFCRNVHDRIPMRAGERSLMLLPLQHIFGICAAYAMLSAGIALGVCPDYRRLYDAAVRFHADFVFLVPALADILVSKIERHRNPDGAPACRLKWVCIGGAPLSFRTQERLSTLGVKVLTAYGLTETTALYSLSDYSRENPPGCAGEVCALSGVETAVSPEGQLMIRGDNVFKGYYRDPERTAAAKDRDGWFQTGDIGRIDADGRVWITGRASRTIVLSSGKKVAPEELEAKILLYPGINEVVVSGDGAEREIVAEIYSRLPEGEVHNIITTLNLSLPVYMRIKRVVCRKSPFPRTASGKIAIPRDSVAKPRRRWSPLLGLSAVGLIAAIALVLGLAPDIMTLDDSPSGGWRQVLDIGEVSGEIILEILMFVLIFNAWRKVRGNRRGR